MEKNRKYYIKWCVTFIITISILVGLYFIFLHDDVVSSSNTILEMVHSALFYMVICLLISIVFTRAIVYDMSKKIVVFEKEKWMKLALTKKIRDLKGNGITKFGSSHYRFIYKFEFLDENHNEQILFGDEAHFTCLVVGATILVLVKGNKILQVKTLKNKTKAIKI